MDIRSAGRRTAIGITTAIGISSLAVTGILSGFLFAGTATSGTSGSSTGSSGSDSGSSSSGSSSDDGSGIQQSQGGGFSGQSSGS